MYGIIMVRLPDSEVERIRKSAEENYEHGEETLARLRYLAEDQVGYNVGRFWIVEDEDLTVKVLERIVKDV